LNTNQPLVCEHIFLNSHEYIYIYAIHHLG
jgi:hypothetical protein